MISFVQNSNLITYMIQGRISMKKRIFKIALVFLCCISLSACGKEKEETIITSGSESEEDIESTEETERSQIEKGFDLPVSSEEKEQAEKDCRKQMELVADLYKNADKGDSSNVVISDEVLAKMQDRVAEEGNSVSVSDKYSNMKNYKNFEDFLTTSMSGESSEAVIYNIHSDGAVVRSKFIFDGIDMYVLTTGTTWNHSGEAGALYCTYTRLKKWRYTEQGWFCYELCVPEYPEVTEAVNGCCLIRVKPISEKNKELSRKYVQGLGYQGNNLLCSSWNVDDMEKLDYNGMYEYLYAMKYQKRFDAEKYQDGIPREKFESLIKEYIPVTSEQLQEYAVFDSVSQMYAWTRLGCGNYAPTLFGTSLPEVTEIEENADGTITMTVHAVCGMLSDDSVMVHKVTVRVNDNGNFQYLGNEILDNGLSKIPEYQYRFGKK